MKIFQDVGRLTAMVFSSYEEKPIAMTHAMGYSVDVRCRPGSGPACL